jgi:hypothetical protein
MEEAMKVKQCPRCLAPHHLYATRGYGVICRHCIRKIAENTDVIDWRDLLTRAARKELDHFEANKSGLLLKVRPDRPKQPEWRRTVQR